MVGSSKILTVSYGTFSCTLEGFDDSFSTMKAIAEYFRDLAADDRYFGAEPATPDAEMLARIAEREISRRVEARTDGSEIVLRAGNAFSAPTSDGQADPATVQDAPQQITPLVEEEAATQAAADSEAQEPGSEGEDLSSLLLAPSEPEAAQTDDAPMTSSVVAAAMPPAQSPPSEPRPRAVKSTDTPALAASAIRPAVALSGHPDAESVAAKLQRIRAVVGRGVATLPPIEEENVQQEQEPTASASDAVIDDISNDDLRDDVLADAKLFDAVETAAAAITADDTVADQDKAPETYTTDRTVSDAAATDDDSTEPHNAEIQSDIEDGADGAADTAAEDDVDPELAPAFDVPAPIRARVIRMRRAINDAVATGRDSAKNSDSTEDEASEIPAPKSEGPETKDTVADDTPADNTGSVDAALVAHDTTAKSLSETVRASIFGAMSSNDAADEVAGHAVARGHGVDRQGDEEDFADAAELNTLEKDALTDEDLSEQEPSDEDLSDLARLDGADEDSTSTPPFSLPASDLSAEEEADLMAELAAAEDEIEEELKLEDDVEDDASWTADISKSADADAEGMAAAESEAVSQDDSLAGFDALEDVWADLGTEAADNEDEDEDEATARADASFETEEEVEEESPALASRRSLIQHADEAAMSRINAQVDVQLNEPEANRRRQAIAQLKAAVAATEAARQMGETREKSPEVENAFRNDLKQVVRPRRPIPATEARTERPRVAPLKLVAAQRIDMPATATAAAQPHGSVHPVRPRRVSIQPEATQPVAQETARSTGSFEAFAKDMGAHSLSDLLEAAAAYTAFVEGSEDFSRPQLMNKVRAMSEDDFSREEGLRSFGTLLREGRIMKTRNGRFQVSDETRFKPERRAG